MPSTKLVALHASCPGSLRSEPAVARRLPQDLPFVISALLAVGVVVAFVLALHSA